jgi:1-phosphofructokinase family hexose kinase
MLSRAQASLWCVSANPAIDKRMRVPKLLPGKVNRASDVRAEPGGKATHVAMVLRTLGADPLWLGFAGGSMGDKMVSGLRDIGIRVQPVLVSQETRTNLEIIDDDGGVTEILEPGLPIAAKDWERFFEACEEAFSQETRPGIVIASGSLPSGAESRIYARLTELAHQCGHKMFLDASGEPMRAALSAAPDFVKPNREEAEWLLGDKIGDRPSWKTAVSQLIQRGARSAVVTLGHDGFVWQSGAVQETYYVKAPGVKVKSSVGSGDATVAAFAFAEASGLDAEKTLRLAAACGAANCLADAPGRASEADVRELEARVHIEKLV